MNIKGYFKFGCLAPHLQVISPTPLVEAALEKIPGASVLFVGRSLMTMLTYGKHDFKKMGNNVYPLELGFCPVPLQTERHFS